MAIKKNTDKGLNIIKKDGIKDSYEKEGFFEDQPEIVQEKNIKLAQALDPDTINNIQSDANPDLIPPDEVQINEAGLPSEENIIQPVENLTNEEEPQIISPENFEGSPNDGLPQQETILESNNLVEELTQIIDGPIEEALDGSPAQGIQSLDQATIESNEESIEIPPQETEFLSVTEENNSEVIDNQLEISTNEAQEIGPEEVVLDSNPSEGVSDQTNFVQAEDDSIGPEISEVVGSPLEEVGDEIDVADTNVEQQDTAEVPDLEQINGGPQQEFSDADQVDIAQNNIAPTESLSSGNPLQTNEQERISDQDETVIETAEIGPEQSEVLGQPSEEIIEDTESEIQLTEIAPELTDVQGSPQEEAVNVEESFQLAEAEEIPPQEGTAQDYIESVFEEKLSEGLEKGLTSEEATIAAIEAGRDAVKESASSPAEINEFAENFNNNIIEDINSKIEKIENDIQQIKEKNINEEAIETEVAQVEEEAVPQEETAETEVAQAAEEAVPQEEISEPPTEVAQANVGSQIINNLNQDQEIDSVLSDPLSVNDQSLNQIETLSSLSEEIEDVEVGESEETFEEESEEILEEIEDDESETQIASVDSLSINNTSDLNLGSTEGLSLDSSLTGNSALLVSGNGVSGNLLGGVSTFGNANILAGPNILSATSSLGIDTIGVTELTSVLGDGTSSLIDSIDIEDTIVEDDEAIFDEPADEVIQPVEKVVEDDTTYVDDTSDDDTSDDHSGSATVNTDPLITPTSGDDNIIGGAGSTDFFYDFSSNTIGGNDTLTDQGTDSDDTIVFEGVPDNYSIFISRDPDGKNEMRLETFNYQDPISYYNTNSVNTINTPISNGTAGIENVIITTDDYYESNPEAIKYEGFYNLGKDSVDNMIQVITGTNANNTFSSNVTTGSSGSYLWSHSDASDYNRANNIELGQTSNGGFPYDDANFDARVYFTKEGNDTLNITNNTDTQYVANMGDGDDKISFSSSDAIEEGSFFDGAAGADTFVFSDNNNHIAFNNSNYEDALLDTSSAILSSAGTAVLVDSIDNAYFKNFETIQLGLGNDTAFFAGDPDNNIEVLGESGDDAFTFNYALTKNITATGGNGVDTFNINTSPNTGALTLKGGAGADTYNFTNNISSTITAGGGFGNDTFSFHSANISGDLTVTGGDGNDIYKFNTVNNGKGLTVNDYITTDDTFSFNSAAFQGNGGHVLVFGEVTGSEFMPDNTITFSDDFPELSIHAFDQTNTQVSDLLTINNDYWYYDTSDGYLYYDQDADQEMSDAVTIAKVTDSTGNALDKTEILSSEIDYFSTSS